MIRDKDGVENKQRFVILRSLLCVLVLNFNVLLLKDSDVEKDRE